MIQEQSGLFIMDAIGEAQWQIAEMRCFQVMPATSGDAIAQFNLRELRRRPTNCRMLAKACKPKAGFKNLPISFFA